MTALEFAIRSSSDRTNYNCLRFAVIQHLLDKGADIKDVLPLFYATFWPEVSLRPLISSGTDEFEILNFLQKEGGKNFTDALKSISDEHRQKHPTENQPLSKTTESDINEVVTEETKVSDTTKQKALPTPPLSNFGLFRFLNFIGNLVSWPFRALYSLIMGFTKGND